MTDRHRHFTLTVTVPAGTIAVGGYTAVPEELDVAHARDPDDCALIPSTAMRGALREALEAALRGAGERACRGGDGLDPEYAAPDARPEPCALAAGRACLPCRLFGSQSPRVAASDGPFGALVLEDARLVDKDHPWTITHGVTIDRSRRSAREGLLFNREAPAPGPGLVFTAEGRLSDPDHRDALEAAAALTCHIGSNQSRGLGRVDLTLDWHPPPTAGIATDARATDTDDRELRVTLRRPAHIGTAFADENTRLARLDIPGSTLRGAVGWAIAEQRRAAGEDPDADAAFQALVAERSGSPDGDTDDAGGGAIFDFLYPCDGDALGGVTGPWPITRRRCKVDPSHITTDVLFDRLALTLAPSPADAARVVAARHTTCPDCGAPRTPARGWRGSDTPPSTRVVTRVALDRRRRSARDGALYSHQVIDVGATYVGSIRALPPGTAARLADGLAAPLSLGRGRSMGWGRVDITVTKPRRPATLAARRAAFTDALRAHLDPFGFDPPPTIDRLVPLTVRSPMQLDSDDDTADIRLIEAALGGRVVLCARRFGVESGYDQRAGPRARVRSVTAGAVYVIELEDPDDARIAAIERDGIGHARSRGYGRVIAYDPAFTHHPRKPMPAPTGEHTRQIVDAAEAVMKAAFANREMRGKLSKSQMSQLIGVCGEATCHEEVRNYLRYQAGRSDPAWTLTMVEEVDQSITSVFAGQDIADDDHAARMTCWRRYATYLARAFTYHDAVRRVQEKA